MFKLRSYITILTIIVLLGATAYLTFPWHYQASLQHCEADGYEAVPGTYTVILDRNYTIRQHQETIGMPELREKHVARTVRSIVRPVETYFTKPITRAVLRKIRSDPKIVHMSCTRLTKGWYGPSGVDGGGKVYMNRWQAVFSGLRIDKVFSRGFNKELVRQNWRFVQEEEVCYRRPIYSGLLGGSGPEKQLNLVTEKQLVA